MPPVTARRRCGRTSARRVGASRRDVDPAPTDRQFCDATSRRDVGRCVEHAQARRGRRCRRSRRCSVAVRGREWREPVRAQLAGCARPRLASRHTTRRRPRAVPAAGRAPDRRRRPSRRVPCDRVATRSPSPSAASARRHRADDSATTGVGANRTRRASRRQRPRHRSRVAPAAYARRLDRSRCARCAAGRRCRRRTRPVATVHVRIDARDQPALVHAQRARDSACARGASTGPHSRVRPAADRRVRRAAAAVLRARLARRRRPSRRGLGPASVRSAHGRWRAASPAANPAARCRGSGRKRPADRPAARRRSG